MAVRGPKQGRLSRYALRWSMPHWSQFTFLPWQGATTLSHHDVSESPRCDLAGQQKGQYLLLLPFPRHPCVPSHSWLGTIRAIRALSGE